MTRTSRAIVALLAGLVIVAGAWGWIVRPKARTYYDTRHLVILSHAAQGDHPVLILGDSIVDMADMPRLCGKAVLNAGISGARIDAVERLTADLLPVAKPKLVIVAIGLNDAHFSAGTTDAEFTAAYRTIVARARQMGAEVRATTIPPVGPSDLGRASEFDRDRITELNALIHQIGVPVIDIHTALNGPDGIEPAAYTNDGVHPNARGYGIWKQVMAQACPHEVS